MRSQSIIDFASVSPQHRTSSRNTRSFCHSAIRAPPRESGVPNPCNKAHAINAAQRLHRCAIEIVLRERRGHGAGNCPCDQKSIFACIHGIDE